MSRVYEIDMNIDISKLTENGGMLMKQGEDKMPVKRNGAEVFALIAGVAINGANPKLSHSQLKTCRGLIAELNAAAAEGVFVATKNDIELIKVSIKRNPGWPNQDEILNVLDQIVTRIGEAKEFDRELAVAKV